MTIWFSTNIPEMRAISVFNKVSKDIGEIQQRIATGQRINSGKDDPGGLILREGLRADIKGVHALQSGMMQADNLMSVASSGMMQLLEVLRGSEANNPTDGGLIGAMTGSMTEAQKQAAAKDFLKLYDAVITSTVYNGQKLIGGDLTTGATSPNGPKTYQLGGGQTLSVAIANLGSDTAAGAANALAQLIGEPAASFSSDDVRAAAATLQTVISTALGTLGSSQNVVAINQRLLDSRLTSTAAAEGQISNADIAVESSRMARAELLAQNAMNSIMYTRNYAAFSVRSLFG